jgi:hypothetical protein
MTREYYPSPRVVVDALMEMMTSIRRLVAAFAVVPPGPPGGFLQPPQGSHFGHD